MKHTLRAALVGASLLSAQLVTVSVNAATPGSKYYACRVAQSVASISVAPHACPRGSATLSGNFAGATFNGASFVGANLAGASLKNTHFLRVSSGKIIGRPSTLPTGWRLVQGYLVGPTANLTGARLSNANLGGANLTGASLRDATLAGVQSGRIVGVPSALPLKWRLIHGYLAGPGANLSGTDLSNLDLAGVDLTSANLTDGTLSGANVTGTVFTGARLSNLTSGLVTGQPASLPAGWMVTRGFFAGPTAVLAGADLSGVDLTSANLAGANFYGADLTNADCTGVSLAGASLSMATIEGAKFANANFTGVISAYEEGTPASLPTNWHVLSGPYQGGLVEYLVGPTASLGGAQLAGVTFAGMMLSNIYLPGGHLVGADFTGATIRHGNLASASLGLANFDSADMAGTNFTAADLSGANFTGANFTGANFTGARLLSVGGRGSATFTGAICPDGIVFGRLGANC
jgi:uncharacterized protein YjbI with pentapeptide repeats